MKHLFTRMVTPYVALLAPLVTSWVNHMLPGSLWLGEYLQSAQWFAVAVALNVPLVAAAFAFDLARVNLGSIPGQSPGPQTSRKWFWRLLSAVAIASALSSAHPAYVLFQTMETGSTLYQSSLLLMALAWLGSLALIGLSGLTGYLAPDRAWLGSKIPRLQAAARAAFAATFAAVVTALGAVGNTTPFYFGGSRKSLVGYTIATWQIALLIAVLIAVGSALVWLNKPGIQNARKHASQLLAATLALSVAGAAIGPARFHLDPVEHDGQQPGNQRIGENSYLGISREHFNALDDYSAPYTKVAEAAIRNGLTDAPLKVEELVANTKIKKGISYYAVPLESGSPRYEPLGLNAYLAQVLIPRHCAGETQTSPATGQLIAQATQKMIELTSSPTPKPEIAAQYRAIQAKLSSCETGK